ncbi:MAG: glycoside hydrolase family 3 N-terminal domain-containing protein [Polyangiales bacterium]
MSELSGKTQALQVLGFLLIGAASAVCAQPPQGTQPTAAPATQPAKPAQPSAADPIEALLARMTLEEKVGQLSQWPGGTTPTGPKAAAGSEKDIRAGRIGSFIGVWGAETTRRLQKIAVEESRLHIPMLFSYDVIHGLRTIFPTPLAEAASWNPELAQSTARTAAIEATAWGLHWTFAPMVDIARDARWGRVVEGAGEDPFLGAAFAVARVRGFQGGNGRDATNMLATAKHFVAYGAAEAGRDYNVVDVSERALHEVYLPPFRAAVEAGVGSVMTSFNEIAGVPMHAHAGLVRDTLRTGWGFNGVVVSDYTGIKELLMHGVAKDRAEAGELGLRATIDVDMIGNVYLQDVPALVKSGRLPIGLVDDCVRRVLKAKQWLGLFDDPYRYSDTQRETARVLTPEARALSRSAAQQSIVLLKNERSLLPLRKDLGSVAVIGELAMDPNAVLGSWHAFGEPSDAVSVLDGIKRAVSPKTRIVYARGAAPNSTDTSGFTEAEEAARSADVVIAVLGESENQSGEARSRTFLGLPGAQQALLERLHATGKPIVLLVMNGRPLALGWSQQHVPAIVETWYLGTEHGNAVADVLFGDVNPSGKLPVTFPRNVGQAPIYYAHKQTGRPPSPKDPFTSKYIDVAWTPLYAFGHGLSYTEFRYDALQLSATKIGPTDPLKVKVKVKNTGKRAGTEIVQLYLRDDVGSTSRPVQQLRGFERVTLEPGASREVSFTLDQEDYALLDASFGRVVEAGTFTVMVGGSSSEVLRQPFEVTRTVKLDGAGSSIPRMLR